MTSQYGVKTVDDEIGVSSKSDYLILAVKPGVYEDVLETIEGHVKEGAVIIVIAVGISFDDIKKSLGDVKVARVQPSTPALVGESDTTILPDSTLEDNEVEELIEIFKSVGKVELLPENLMDIVPSIASSAPAYALMLISAMADGGVLNGFPRDQATRLSAQAVLGAAKLVLETGESPDDLKNNICTPGGTTIEAVVKLEEHGFRSSVIEAVDACSKKAKRMIGEDSSN